MNEESGIYRSDQTIGVTAGKPPKAEILFNAIQRINNVVNRLENLNEKINMAGQCDDSMKAPMPPAPSLGSLLVEAPPMIDQKIQDCFDLIDEIENSII